MQNGKTSKAKRKSNTHGFEISNSLFPSPKNKFLRSVEAISLLLLQLVSLATTLDGAGLLFGDEKMPFVEKLPIAYVLGFGIQLLLIGILVLHAFEDKPVRRLLALILLSAFSIYTNFFSIYNILNGGLLEQNTSIDLARRKYENLIAYFYTNPKEELNQLEQKAASLQCSLYQEDPAGTPKPENCPSLGFDKGKGERYDEYKAELDGVNADLRNFNQTYVRDTAPQYFDGTIIKSLEGKDARQIFELTQEALKDVPLQVKNQAISQGYNPDEYDDVTDFFPEKGSSYFFLPAQKVFASKENRETVAVIGLVLATAIDGISLLLGAELEGFYVSLKESMGSINPIADILNGSFSYIEDIGKSIVPFIEAPLVYLGRIWFSFAEGGGALIIFVFNGFGVLLTSLINGILGLFKYILSNLRDHKPGNKVRLGEKNGDGVEFLDTFYDSIIRGKSQSLQEDSSNSQLYKSLISDMTAKGYFEKANATEKNRHSTNTNTSRPSGLPRKNYQQDLILTLKGKQAFHNWYVNQRNLQLEKQLNNLGNKDQSLNTIDFPPEL